MHSMSYLYQGQKRGLFLLISLLFAASTILATAQESPLEIPMDWPLCEERLSEHSATEFCGSLQVQADHFVQDSEQLSVPIRWIASVNPTANERPPVMRFNGGPGSSNLSGAPSSHLLAEFNVLIVGFRGIDFGPDMECLEVADAITSADRILEDGRPLLRAAIAQCIEGLESQGFTTDQISVAQILHDMNAVQSQLGFERVHIFGGSFGTRLGLIYQEVFPGNIDRSVFIAGNPPGHTIWTPQALDNVLARVASLCAHEGACTVSPSEMLAALRYRHDGPATYLGIEFDPERARNASFLMSYDAGMIPLIADAFLNASQGDNAGLFALSMAHDMAVKNAGMHWGHLTVVAANSDFEPGNDYNVELAPSAEAPYGSPFAQLIWAAIDEDQIPLINPAYRKLTGTPHETLLISGELDFAGPFEQVRDKVLPFRPNATFWLVPNTGHYNLYGSDLMDAAAGFLLNGEATQPPAPEPFSLMPSVGFGDMLKLGFAALVFVFVLIILIVRFFIRRGRRKRRA